MKIQACLTNKSDLWKTPSKMYKKFIDLGYYDPCPSNPTFDGLNTNWQKINFVNPPYSQINKWINKAIIEMQKGNLSIMLLPARTYTQWFKKLIQNNACISLLEGRLKFNDTGTAPFPSMIVTLSKDRTIPVIELLTKEQQQIYL